MWPNVSRHQRGYGADWDKKRRAVLQRDERLCRCEDCRTNGRIKVATEVDHIVSRAKAKMLGWTDVQVDDMSNLQSINSECHKKKTQEEVGNRIDERRTAIVGADGWRVRAGPGGRQ